jgi:hypothetical protein
VVEATRIDAAVVAETRTPVGPPLLPVRNRTKWSVDRLDRDLNTAHYFAHIGLAELADRSHMRVSLVLVSGDCETRWGRSVGAVAEGGDDQSSV